MTTTTSLSLLPSSNEFIGVQLQSLPCCFPYSLSDIDPIITSEIFSTAAHVSLDLSTLVVPITPIFLQLLSVMGRLFCIASDYIPDHTMLPEEFVYQISMLGISTTALVRSLQDTFNASTRKLTMRDRKCFASLFRPAGVTLMQFKMLMATETLEWKDMTQGSLITCEESSSPFESNKKHEVHSENNYIYWLYNGELEGQSKSNVIQTIKPKRKHLIGDLSFTFKAPLEKKKLSASSVESSTKKHKKGYDKYPTATVRVKSDIATVLRFDITKLKHLMAGDKLLDRAIQDLLLDSMQERLSSLMTLSRMIAQQKEKQHRTYFHLLFQSTGLSWSQYKTLVEQSALTLHHASPGSNLTSPFLSARASNPVPVPTYIENNNNNKNKNSSEHGHYLYWLCEGELTICSEYGKVFQTMTPATGHVFGDLTAPIVPTSLKVSFNTIYPKKLSIRVGRLDSVLLRVDSRKMKKLMDEDKSFRVAVSSLMYIQEQTIKGILSKGLY